MISGGINMYNFQQSIGRFCHLFYDDTIDIVIDGGMPFCCHHGSKCE